MGSGASALAYDTPGGELRLPASGLRFSVPQLRALNGYIDVLFQEDQKGRMSTETEGMVESLVQRIVDGAGQRDPRFKCCHLIALHRGKKMRSRSLEYLVTLDALPPLDSTEECTLSAGPVGFGRARLTGRLADKWEEFLTPAGFLCRDKLVERWVELIARCTSARGGGGSRVLSARAAARAQPHEYCYLERVSQPQSPPDRRLAIVEGAAWVMVRVGAGEAEAKLMLGVRVEGHSAGAYTRRIPLTHPMALLHYTAAQGGYYLAAVGPPSSLACGDRTATWQIWHPSLEAALDGHCSEWSTVARVAGALNALVDKMRDGVFQGTLHVLSRYTALCALRRRLDACARAPQLAARALLSAHSAHHLLLVLDDLLSICSADVARSAGYVHFMTRAGLSRRATRTNSWEADGNTIRHCLMALHRIPGEDIPPSPTECLEVALFSKWEGLSLEARSASGAGSTGPRYSRRQLRYLFATVSQLRAVCCYAKQENHSNFRKNLLQVTSSDQDSVEDLIHIVALMLDQARDLYGNTLQARSVLEFDRESSAYRSKKWHKLKDYYDASAAYLIDAVRRDPDLRQENLSDPITIMTNVLNWLYKGMREDKKYLGPVLKPYLEGLYNSSVENCWFLEEFEKRRCDKEMEGLKEYCLGVHGGNVEACEGILEAAKKHAWAKALVDFVDRYRQAEFRLVFPTGDGMAISYPVKFPRSHGSARVLTLSRRDKAEAKLRLARAAVLQAFASTLQGHASSKPSQIHGSSEEILNSFKTGNYWRNNTKPDIIPSTSTQDLTQELPKVRRRSRRRPLSSYGYPEINITKDSDKKTLRKKYHTLKGLVYTEPVDSVKELKERSRSACSSVRSKEPLSRPSLLETLDFINSVKDSLCVEESGTSDVEDSWWSFEDAWLAGQTAPLNLLTGRAGTCHHLVLADVVSALMCRGKFTILQELCSWLGAGSEGALFSLHRLARAARSRSSDRDTTSWQLPEAESEGTQTYRRRAPDASSGDEAPPVPRRGSSLHTQLIPKRQTDYLIPNRLKELEEHLLYLEKVNSKLNLTHTQSKPLNDTYTGIINPIYDKMPKDRFSVKRSRSLGRSFSTKSLGLEITRYNLTLGHRSGVKTNDVVTAIQETTGETGLECKSNFFQRQTTASVVGDSYKMSRVTID